MDEVATDDFVTENRNQTYSRASYVAALFDDHHVSLRRLAFALVGDAGIAEEISQEAFVRLYASPRRLDRMDDPSSFLRRIVINLCRSKARRTGVARRLDPLMTVQTSEQQPDIALRLDIWSALGSLPQRQRACAVLHYLEDLPATEISELLGCSVGTVKSQLHKARQKLGPLLSEPEGESDG